MAVGSRTALPDDLELLLRRVIREEAGLTPVAPEDDQFKGTGGDSH
jgi:hypothetical protein